MRKLYSAVALVGLLGFASTLRAQNTNQDAPTAKHSLAFKSGLTVELSYQQLTLAGGSSLKALMTKGERGKGARDFYNNRYLPGTLKGEMKLSHGVTLADHALEKGTYGFTFRIDEELKWHMIVMSGDKEVCDLVLESRDSKDVSARLSIVPTAGNNEKATGHLAIHYGPLSSAVAFAPAGASSKPSDSKPTSRPDRGAAPTAK